MAKSKGIFPSVEDIYLPLNHLFNQAAKRAFTQVVTVQAPFRTPTIHGLQHRVVDQVKFFGARADGERQIFDAAQKVANFVNDYASRGFITGAMQKLILVQLATEPYQLEQYIVMSYVALAPEGLNYMSQFPTPLEFAQGSVPAETIKSVD